MRKTKNKNSIMMQNSAVKEFQRIPGVGPSIAQDIVDLGFSGLHELNNGNPEAMYNNLCKLRKHHVDRCVLYVFRAAVYYVSHKKHNPELLKWWNWKDK
ncbi:MAG: helix-hairpin-helix domain-containing protein [Candidatus Omnitrophota bacterium]